jgi:hypothetical protein
MATFFYRQKHSRRRLAALNFLSNISLDGSFQDLKYDPASKATGLCDSFAGDQDCNTLIGKSNKTSLYVNENGKTDEGFCTAVTIQEEVNIHKVVNSDIKCAYQEEEEMCKLDLDLLVKEKSSIAVIRER